MTQKFCKNCKKIIIREWEEFVKKYPFEKQIMCPYCCYIEELI